MKRNIKSVLLVSLAAMGQPSSSSPIGNPSGIPLDVRIDDAISDSINCVDGSIPCMEGVPLDISVGVKERP